MIQQTDDSVISMALKQIWLYKMRCGREPTEVHMPAFMWHRAERELIDSGVFVRRDRAEQLAIPLTLHGLPVRLNDACSCPYVYVS